MVVADFPRTRRARWLLRFLLNLTKDRTFFGSESPGDQLLRKYTRSLLILIQTQVILMHSIFGIVAVSNS